MGCDGGTIPKRDELVRLKKKPEKKDKNADLAAKWKHCALSQEPLVIPIVACEMGRLYNKEKVIEFLLDKSKFECAASFDHIRGLKDVKELQLTENSEYKTTADKGDGYVDHSKAKYICPVTGLEMSGRYRFVTLWNCGCVISERALKEISSNVCHKCQKPFLKSDIIILNGGEEDNVKMMSNMEERRLKAKLEKKSKKKSKAEAATGNADEPPQKMLKQDESTSQASSSTSASTSKIDEPPTKKLTNGIHKDTRPVNGKLMHTGTSDKLKPVQKDQSKSAAYKSLFTSSEKARNQPKGHWVTYNPCYY